MSEGEKKKRTAECFYACRSHTVCCSNLLGDLSYRHTQSRQPGRMLNSVAIKFKSIDFFQMYFCCWCWFVFPINPANCLVVHSVHRVLKCPSINHSLKQCLRAAFYNRLSFLRSLRYICASMCMLFGSHLKLTCIDYSYSYYIRIQFTVHCHCYC